MILYVPFFFLMIRRQTRSTLFPYTTLFRSDTSRIGIEAFLPDLEAELNWELAEEVEGCESTGSLSRHNQDRKSTRLNSSHANISYAVFCLKKKKRQKKKKKYRNNNDRMLRQ